MTVGLVSTGDPKSSGRPVASYLTGKDSNGVVIELAQDVNSYRANSAIAQGDLVRFVAPTATAPLSVETTPATATLPAGTLAGVALAAAAAGDTVRVAKDLAWVKGTGTAGQYIQTVATAGSISSTATAAAGVQFGAVIVATTANFFGSTSACLVAMNL